MGVNEIVTKRWRQQESAFRFAFPQLCSSKNSLQCLLRLLSFLDPFHIWSLQKPSQLINIHLPLTDLNQPSLLRLAVQIISVFCNFQCTYKWIIYTVFAGLPLFTNQTLGKWIFWNWKSFLEIQYICQCKWTQKRDICKPFQVDLLRRCNRCFPGLVCFSRPTWNCFVQRQHHPHKSTSSIIDAFSGNLLHQLAHFHKGVILFQADDNLPLR